MSRPLIDKIEKAAKNRVVVEYFDGKKAIFDLMKMPGGSRVYLVTLLDENGKIIGAYMVPAP